MEPRVLMYPLFQQKMSASTLCQHLLQTVKSLFLRTNDVVCMTIAFVVQFVSLYRDGGAGGGA